MTVTLRLAILADAPAIAALHADSWRFAYRGAYSDEYLDGPVFEDRARVWQERMLSPRPNQHVILATRHERGWEFVRFSIVHDTNAWSRCQDSPNLG